jgi:carboxymethylenebutenolidase
MNAEPILARALVLVILLAVAVGAGAAEPQEVTFASGDLELHGYIFKPDGSGPFPGILYNHGSEKRPGTKPEIGNFFASNGYVVFVPHRRGQGRSPGNYIMDGLNNAPRGMRGQLLVNLHEEQQQDLVSALDYMKSLQYVDAKSIAVAGCSFGGIQTVLATEKDLGLRAAIPFAPGAMTWSGSTEIRARLIAAVKRATVPVFLIQAENDYDLSPTRVLSQEMEQAGKPHQAKIFPPYGTTPREGHGGFCSRGMNVWGSDVLAFLASSLRRK